MNVFERLGHDSDKQVQHHNIHNEKNKGENDPDHCRCSTVIITVGTRITDCQSKCIRKSLCIGLSLKLSTSINIIGALCNPEKGLVECYNHSHED